MAHGPHNFFAFCVFFAKTQDSPQKMAGGPFQNGRGFFELQKFFSNIINHLKNLKKIQLKSACRVLSTRIFFSQKIFCRYTPINNKFSQLGPKNSQLTRKYNEVFFLSFGVLNFISKDKKKLDCIFQLTSWQEVDWKLEKITENQCF